MVEVKKDYLLAAGQTLTVDNDIALTLKAPDEGQNPAKIVIAGTLSGTYSRGGVAITSENGAGFKATSISIENGGAIKVAGSGATTVLYAIGLGTYPPILINHGLLEVTGDYVAGAVSTQDSTFRFENDGTVLVTSKNVAYGAILYGGGALINSGRIEVTGASGNAVSTNAWNADFENTGRIIFNSTSAAPGVAVSWYSQIYQPGHVWTNRGLIQADIALEVYTSGTFVQEFVNSGTMIGKIKLGNASTLFTNTGAITGDVSLGNGGATFDTSRGALNGSITGGAGADIIKGSASNDWIDGSLGSDTLDGGGGVNVLSFASLTSAIRVDLVASRATSGADVDTFTNFQRYVGSKYADVFQGGAGDDLLDGGRGWNTAVYSGARSAYSWTVNGDGAVTVKGAGTDTLSHFQILRFSDGDVVIGPTTVEDAIDLAFIGVLRRDLDDEKDHTLRDKIRADATANHWTPAAVVDAIVDVAASTSSVATLSYAFFVGKTPSAAGMDYLISPTGPNYNNLNSAYYTSFNVVNRYINFAVNLGKNGEGKASFAAKYGDMTLFDATREAYKTIFGSTPTDEKLHALLDTRVNYFAGYGRDGANGIGTKAAMVGWLLSAGVSEGVGMYAKANEAFLTDVGLHNASYGVDLIGVYGKADYIYNG